MDVPIHDETAIGCAMNTWLAVVAWITNVTRFTVPHLKRFGHDASHLHSPYVSMAPNNKSSLLVPPDACSGIYRSARPRCLANEADKCPVRKIHVPSLYYMEGRTETKERGVPNKYLGELTRIVMYRNRDWES